MPPRDSWQGTFVVALVLCLACSAVVSIAAVSLKGIQDDNKALDKKKNVLLAAGLATPESSADEINSTFESSVVRKLVDLETGKVLTDEELEELEIDPALFDPKKWANDPDARAAVEPAGALMGSNYRSPYAEVYEFEKDGESGYVFPIYGMGLWGTLYGFLAVDGDGETVEGITYYQHKETPGLGGEVDNPGWKALWPGKKIYEQEGEVALSVIKGAAPSGDPYAIDGLSGATITSKGVDNMVKYWLGPDAFGQYLAKQG